MRDGRWITEAVLDHEAEAITTAKKYLNAGTAQGARVIAERTIGEDRSTEKTVFEEMRAVSDKRPVTLNAIDDAPWCDDADALYALPARMTLTRLLRTYMDRNTILASELLYAFRPLQRLQDHDSNIYPAAVDRIATLQAAGREDVDIKTRRDALYVMIDEVGRRARRAEGEKVMRQAGLDDLPAAYRRAERAAFDPKEQDFLVRAAIGRDLACRQSWLGKLEALLEAVSDDLPDGALPMLDGFIADCLGVGEVIQEVLGDRPNLGGAIIALMDLAEGKGLPPTLGAPSKIAEDVAQLFAGGRLPESATVLMERVYREVGGRSPLSRNDPTREHEVYELLAARFITRQGVVGGPRMAVAMTRRYTQRIEQGGDAGWRHAIVGVSSMLMDGARRLHYLATLSLAPEMETHITTILEMIVDAIKASRTVDDLTGDMPPPQKLTTVTSVQRALMNGHGIPEVMQQRVFAHFDSMLAKYVEQAHIIERLDHPSDSLRQRAERLISFCGSGVLLEGKALAVARERVLGYLKRPDFMTEFLNDVPPDQQETEVRKLHSRLARAGFGGAA